MPVPSSYVLGLGRGSRSDIGPAREAPSKETVEAAQLRRGELIDDEAFQDPETESGLFSGIQYDADDDAADEIFDKIDRKMGSRRKHHRKIQEIQPKEPKIQTQFMDLKRALSSVTDEEWGKIPEVSNLTKRRKVKETRSYAIPDSILVGDRNKFRLETSLSDEQQFTADESDIIGLSTAREEILSLKLDQVSTSTSAVNPKEYLVDNIIARTDTEVGNIKKARLLVDRCSRGVGEYAGNMVTARKLINTGCEQCPNNEEIWLEAMIILVNAVQHVQQSVKIWLTAAELEAGTGGKRRIFRKALESIPTSVKLWKEAINLETSASEASLLLTRAVERVPQSVELWLALARLQPFEQAKSIAAAPLLESDGANAETIDDIVAASVQKLRSRGVQYTREQWLTDAELSDECGMPQTCGAIVKATISMDVEPEDQVDAWLEDIETVISRDRTATAPAYMLKVFPERADVWEKAIEIDSPKNALLEQAVAQCPTAERHRLMLARQKQLDGDVPAARKGGEVNLARSLLAQARDAVNTERLWIKSAVFERLQGNFDEALSITNAGLTKFPTCAKLYIIQGQINDILCRTISARASFVTGLKACPKDPKLWISVSRFEEKHDKSIKARSLLEKARVVLPTDELIWAEAVQFEERLGAITAAKAILVPVLQACPTSSHLGPRRGRDDQVRPLVLCTIARLFWAERKILKARHWFEEATAGGSDIGDIWAWWLNLSSISEDDKNVHQGAEFILELVSGMLDLD
ncbi:PRP1 splicing factor, N-terminal-domain-containing protein [Mycena sanguinolenta]|nr:PRP1 splicing factor, N-terminal-domain-containing protein [Mycena sanguinolenta]